MQRMRARLVGLVVATACGALMLLNGAGRADTLKLPEPTLPEGLKAYSNTQTLASAAAYVVDQLSSGTLQKGDEGCTPSYSCHYSEPPFPETRINEKNGSIELITSPCESDLEAQSVHRGWALIAISYRLFAEFIEPPDHKAPTGSPMASQGQTFDFEIARFGRTALLRAVSAAQIAHLIGTLDANHLPVQTRADIVAFLKVLLAFKDYHDLLVSKGDSIRTWMSNDELIRAYGETSPKLVARINALLPPSTPQLNSCLAGYWEHSLLLKDGKRIPSNAIYSQGIAMYSVSFWWRRQGEGTSALAEAALHYAIDRLR